MRSGKTRLPCAINLLFAFSIKGQDFSPYYGKNEGRIHEKVETRCR